MCSVQERESFIFFVVSGLSLCAQYTIRSSTLEFGTHMQVKMIFQYLFSGFVSFNVSAGFLLGLILVPVPAVILSTSSSLS